MEAHGGAIGHLNTLEKLEKWIGTMEESKFKRILQAFFKTPIIKRNVLIVTILSATGYCMYQSKQRCMLELNASEKKIRENYDDIKESNKKEREAQEIKREAQEIKREAQEIKRDAQEIKREAQEIKREAQKEADKQKKIIDELSKLYELKIETINLLNIEKDKPVKNEKKIQHLLKDIELLEKKIEQLKQQQKASIFRTHFYYMSYLKDKAIIENRKLFS